MSIYTQEVNGRMLRQGQRNLRFESFGAAALAPGASAAAKPHFTPNVQHRNRYTLWIEITIPRVTLLSLTSNSMSMRTPLRLGQVSRQFARALPFRRPVGRRCQTTEATPAASNQSTIQRLWNSPVGVKTVHFWFDLCVSSRVRSRLTQC